MVKRTEEEKVSQASIEVILGGKTFKIAPLVIRDSREWRKKVISLIATLPQLINVTMDNPDDFGEALTEMLVTMPDQAIDLFFEYAKLDREEIESIATDAEMAKALEEVIQVAFPLAASLPKVLGRLSP